MIGIHIRHWPNGWFWLIDENLIGKINIPIVVFSIGNNYWLEEQIPQRGVSHLNKTKMAAAHFSLRDDGSLLRSAFLGSVDVVPDAGFFLPWRFKDSDRPIASDYVMLQLAGDKQEMRFGGNQGRAQCLDAIATWCKSMSSEGYVVVAAPHVFDDIELYELLEECYGIELVWWPFKSCSFMHTESLHCWYEHCSLSVAMRGHGQIIPLAFGNPVIALVNHPKHSGLLERYSLSDYAVSLDSMTSADLEKLSLDALHNKEKFSSVAKQTEVEGVAWVTKLKSLLL